MSSADPLLNRPAGIILSADLATLEELEQFVALGACRESVVAVKVGFSLGLRHGLPQVAKRIRAVCDLPVIYDHQKAGTDIPQMGEPFASVCAEAGIYAAIFFPQAGPRSLEGFVSAAANHGLIPIVGLVMTHAAYLESDGGFLLDEAPLRIAQIAIDLGVRYFVLPGTKPDTIKRFSRDVLGRYDDVAIMMPGIGSQGGSLVAALDAAKPHRRYAIIGSAIYNAADPHRALEKFDEEIRHAG